MEKYYKNQLLVTSYFEESYQKNNSVTLSKKLKQIDIKCQDVFF